MLDLLATVKQRSTSHTCFEKPTTNAKSGEVLKNGAGGNKQFLPNSCRGSCPIKASKQASDDPKMKKLLVAADIDHEAWKLKMAARVKEVSKKEIALRKFDLGEIFIDL